MAAERPIAFALAVALIGLAAGRAAELPAQSGANAQPKKAKPPEAVQHCNIGGIPGIMAANGVCVRLSGYVSTGVEAGQIK